MFSSTYKPLAKIEVPTFFGKSGDQLYMIPFNFYNLSNVPEKWQLWLLKIKEFFPSFYSSAHLTVDQKLIKSGKPHRRGGLHIDGNYEFENDWGGGGNGWLNGVSGIFNSSEDHQRMYLKKGLGTLLISDYAACEVHEGVFTKDPSAGGNCEHLRDELSNKKSEILKPNVLYWLDSQCVHESLPISRTIKRTLIRITLPMK